jgi:hypothetical protein
MCENAWREANCPDYGYVYCECPYIVPECPGSLNCALLEGATMEVMAYYDNNNDGAINPND